MTAAEFNLDEILKKRGTKSYGFIDLAIRPDGSTVKMPYMIVCGKNDGPIFVAEAGCHGEEYDGGEGIALLANRLDPNDVSGTFIGIPASNMVAFAQGVRINTLDFSCQDMNRGYPLGDPKGFITKRILNYFIETFFKRANYVVCFHDGGKSIHLTPMSIYHWTDDERGRTAREMAYAFGTCAVASMQKYPCQPGVSFFGSVYHNVPNIQAELGGLSEGIDRPKFIEMSADGLENIMKYAKMLPGEPRYLQEGIDRLGEFEIEYLRTNNGGIHKPLKKSYDPVKKGDVLSEIVDVFGEKVDEVVAPYDGVVLGYWSYAMVQPGHWTTILGEPIQR